MILVVLYGVMLGCACILVFHKGLGDLYASIAEL
jgi:hypothetical protein